MPLPGDHHLLKCSLSDVEHMINCFNQIVITAAERGQMMNAVLIVTITGVSSIYFIRGEKTQSSYVDISLSQQDLIDSFKIKLVTGAF